MLTDSIRKNLNFAEKDAVKFSFSRWLLSPKGSVLKSSPAITLAATPALVNWLRLRLTEMFDDAPAAPLSGFPWPRINSRVRQENQLGLGALYQSYKEVATKGHSSR